jgi:hypothetical protein
MLDLDDADVDEVLVIDPVLALVISSASSSPSVWLPTLPPPPLPPPLPILPALPLVMVSPTLLYQLFPYLYIRSKETASLHP